MGLQTHGRAPPPEALSCPSLRQNPPQPPRATNSVMKSRRATTQCLLCFGQEPRSQIVHIHGCWGGVRYGCWEASPPKPPAVKLSAAPPPPKPAIACTS